MYIIRDVQDFLIERWGQRQMRSDVDLQLAAHAKQVRLEKAQLREQNRVLRRALEQIAMSNEVWERDQMIDCAQAALTATRQPTAAEVHQRMFDHGDATSQEGQG